MYQSRYFDNFVERPTEIDGVPFCVRARLFLFHLLHSDLRDAAAIHFCHG
jgi:hypothetical protein